MKNKKQKYSFGNSNYRKMNSDIGMDTVNGLILAAYKNLKGFKKIEFFKVLALLGACNNNKKYTLNGQAKSIANAIQNFKYIYGNDGFTPCNTNDLKEIVYGIELTPENRIKYPILDKDYPSEKFSEKCCAGYMIFENKVHTWLSDVGLNDEAGLDYLAAATAKFKVLSSVPGARALVHVA